MHVFIVGIQRVIDVTMHDDQKVVIIIMLLQTEALDVLSCLLNNALVVAKMNLVKINGVPSLGSRSQTLL